MFKKFCKSSSGQALLEFALVLPLFVLLTFGVIEVSKIGYSYVTLNNAVRSGARVASVGGLDEEITNTIATSSTYLDQTLLNITIIPEEMGRRSGSQVKVVASYPVYLSTPIISQVLPNPVTVNSSLAMRIE
jgi:Flp pilus assembly protein TadG